MPRMKFLSNQFNQNGWMDVAEDRARAFPELNVQYGGKKKKPDLKNF